MTPPRHAWSTLARCLLACGLVACSSRDSSEQRAVEHLCWLEDRLRSAPNPDKAPFLADLGRAACPAADACAMRDQCLAGYRLHVDALSLTQAAKQALADGQGEQAAKLLGSAEAKLKAAAGEVARCTDLAAELRRRRSIR